MIDRPTFSETWYRVAEVRPRLRSSVQSFRQHFRGRTFHVLQDPNANQFYRLDDAGYLFVALLDGKRTVQEVWDLCNEKLGDRAPTQGEAIQLLGQLWASNLLQADLSPDAQSMFDRQRKRIGREVRGYLMNLLFSRFPIFDPDRFLERWVSVFGLVFTWPALVLWLMWVGFAFANLTGRWDELFAAGSASNVLAPDNLPLLYLAFACIKILHEFGHGFACKRFGKIDGGGGEVHTLGVMLLIFTPVPYVDASSAWAFRSKWRRAVVGAAGMYVELAVAGIAAVVWAHTTAGSPLHAFTYNILFVASVSTVLFNANPLLRFDGYYMLSDVLEIPNLAQRGKDYLYFLVKKYVFGVRNPLNPARSHDEKPWLVVYAIAAFIYRIIISVGILLFVAGAFFFVGMAMALAALVGWLVVPTGKFLHYLWVGPELMRTRGRAMYATFATAAVVFIAVGVIPFPDRSRAEGVIEPRRVQVIHAGADGFVHKVLPSGLAVAPDRSVMVTAENPKLVADHRAVLARLDETTVRIGDAMREEMAVAQSFQQRRVAYTDQLHRLDQQLNDLTVEPPFPGQWVAPEVEQLVGSYIHQGDKLGLVADISELIVRVPTDQYLGPLLEKKTDAQGQVVSSVREPVEMRVRGRPDIAFTGVIDKVLIAGSQTLPSEALGYMVGGSIATVADDRTGRKSAERMFNVTIRPDPNSIKDLQLFSGQRVIVRFTMAKYRPLIFQWWTAARQVIQKRLQV
jgi:putative peptide zinc metalloprotease protein